MPSASVQGMNEQDDDDGEHGVADHASEHIRNEASTTDASPIAMIRAYERIFPIVPSTSERKHEPVHRAVHVW